MTTDYLFNNKVGPSVVRPVGFILACKEWAFFTITHGADTCWAYAKIYQILFGIDGTTFTKCQVVFVGSPLITISFNDNHSIGGILHVRGIRRENGSHFRVDSSLIKIKIDRAEHR